MIKKLLLIPLLLVATAVTMPRIVYDFHQHEVRCLAEAVYQESRGESVYGQLAVAKVVVNRTRSLKWPLSICMVVFQPYQFTWTAWWTGWQADQHSLKIAKLVLENPQMLHHFKATHFHNTSVKPLWSRKLKRLEKIGNHVFYS